MRIKTKAICTIGPTSENEDIFERLVIQGMDIVRLNFSHATPIQFIKIKKLIDKFNVKYRKRVQILVDLQGPRMRVGNLPIDGIKLEEGKNILFSTDLQNKEAIYINNPYLHFDIEIGHPIYLSNGDMEVMVVDKNGLTVKTKVIRGGILYSKKGLNFPKTDLKTKGLTAKDLKDIEFGVKNKADFIALSFVRDSKDISEARKLIKGSRIKIISKIERYPAIQNLEEIIKASDLIMVARGDLGIEMPIENLPVLQKEIIEKSIKLRKPSIVATQMLASMVNHYRPTRAEVSDIANAVLDGAWGLMLSDETAFGKYPVNALDYLVRTIQKTEQYEILEALTI